MPQTRSPPCAAPSVRPQQLLSPLTPETPRRHTEFRRLRLPYCFWVCVCRRTAPVRLMVFLWARWCLPPQRLRPRPKWTPKDVEERFKPITHKVQFKYTIHAHIECPKVPEVTEEESRTASSALGRRCHTGGFFCLFLTAEWSPCGVCSVHRDHHRPRPAQRRR